MSLKEVLFEGTPPWGFRMNGGADTGHQLRISRVNPASKAELKGVREGDLITSINGQATKCLTNSESHALLRTVKENLRLGLNEDKNSSQRRRSKEIKSSPAAENEQSPGGKEDKPSSSKSRRQRRARLKNRIKGLFGYRETTGHVINRNPFEPKNEEGATENLDEKENLPTNSQKTDCQVIVHEENGGKKKENVSEPVENCDLAEPVSKAVEIDICSADNENKAIIEHEDVCEETIKFLPPNDINLSVATTVDDELYELDITDIYEPLIEKNEEEKLRGFLGTLNLNPEYQEACPPYPSHLYPRRYLEVISEENSDVSDIENNKRKKEIDWGSQDGIDTSWRDGKSLEEVSDVPILSDSFSDSDLLEDKKRQDCKEKPLPSPAVVKNVVSCYYAKLHPEPIHVDTLNMKTELNNSAPFSQEVVEIVYIDSSDSDLLSSKSDLNISSCYQDPKLDPVPEDINDNINVIISDINQTVSEISPEIVKDEKWDCQGRRFSYPLSKSDFHEAKINQFDDDMMIRSLSTHSTQSFTSQSTTKNTGVVATLTELSANVVLSFPYGMKLLKQIGIDYTDFDQNSGYIPEGSEYSNSSKMEINQCDESDAQDSITYEFPQIDKGRTNIYNIENDWIGISLPNDPRYLVCLSPSQYKQLPETRNNIEGILDLHQKFLERRGYHEQPPKNEDFETSDSDIEFISLQKYHESRQKKMRQKKINEKTDQEIVGNSRLLELIQSLEQSSNGTVEVSPRLETTMKIEIENENFEPEVKLRHFKDASDRPRSLPNQGEIFRQKMYDEYMNKLAEMTERRQLKVIKLSSSANSVSTMNDQRLKLENEFMDRVKERMNKLGLENYETESDERSDQDIPKHLQELMELTDECDIIDRHGLLVEIDQALSPERKGFLTLRGVWSPAQTPETERKQFDFDNSIKQEDKSDEPPPPPIWTPRSADQSPTVERKFRSVNFQSPTLKRKEYKQEQQPELPKELPVETRLVLSNSENSNLISPLRLPSSQNPTITLLQKAREGHIPKGAQYLEDASTQETSTRNDERFTVKKEYYTSDDEGSKKVIELTPKKFEGIGPTTREGIPIGLRSEVKEDNQQKWYKRMYDSLHKADHDNQYPYSYAGGYASEPERLGYDSDASASKYATLDRRKIRNKENDFTTSTLPRNRYAPAVKHAVNYYKGQPGRIEDYEPGNSSIAETETRQWWDEVLDIFDGELHQQTKTDYFPEKKPYNYALKDTGYDSDSTLVFKRREAGMNQQLLSPAEQKMAYKVIQRGGEVPLHGLRKTVPDRPREDSEIEYFPISPTLTRIRVHKKMEKPQEKVFYPVSDEPLFGNYKRTARRASSIPSPPRRLSSLKLSKSYEKSHEKEIKPKLKVKSDDKKDFIRKSPELKAPNEVKKALKDPKKEIQLKSYNRKPLEKVKISVPITSKSNSPGSKSPTSPKSPTPKTILSKPKILSKINGSTQSLIKTSRPSSIASTVSNEPKKDKKINGDKKKEKKPEIKIKNDKKEVKSIKKKIECKKKTNIKKKDKENVPEINEGNERPEFFQHLLLGQDSVQDIRIPEHVQRSPSVSDRVKKFVETQSYKSEPSLRNVNVYLTQKKPVSESRFRSLDRRPLSPYYGTHDFFDKLDKFDKHNDVWDTATPTYESIKSRSSSEPPCTSPSQEEYQESPSVSRSPSSRRIRRSANKTIESVAGLKRKVRSKSLNETDRQSINSTSSYDNYQSYVLELLHSTPKSDRFKELHKFYSSLERMAELEKTTSNSDLRPRLKNEEIIDFDRWQELRKKEKAEVELNNLFLKLKGDQKEKGLLFLPKETVRWQGDRGLRNKEKSVEDLRQKFQRMVESSESKTTCAKDAYTPLWRGNSVVNLAHSLTSITGSRRGRPIYEPEIELKHVKPKHAKEIGSRLWSSLSMDQVNALKCQLSEIYSTVSNLKHERIQKLRQNIEDYEMNVADLNPKESLHVRSNSMVSPDQLYSPSAKKREYKRQCMKADSISAIPQKGLSEPEKKKISMSLSAEVKERIKKKKHGSLVIPRETLGAVAAIKSMKKFKESSPRTCSLLSDDSDKEKKNKDLLLVLTPKEQQSDVKKICDDWGAKLQTSSSSSSASTVIHLGSRDDFKEKYDLSQSTNDLRMESPMLNKLTSQSYTDLKELYGEQQATDYATLPLKNNLNYSNESLSKSFSPDPMRYYRAYLRVKAGDVRKLKEKFESYDDIYNLHRESRIEPKFQSDPDLTRDYLSRKGGEFSKIVIKGQELGDVQWLRKRYEPRKISPVPFKIEDRYMPHINVISKTASLQRSHTPPPRTEASQTGQVEKLKQQYEQQVSLLGQMYTSNPEITELRDIASYLECDWVAHRNPRSPKPVRRFERKRPASASPIRQSILKHNDIFANQHFNPEIHRPLYRYQPDQESDKSWNQKHQWNIRPTVTFKEPLGNPIPTPPRENIPRNRSQESPHRYVESEVNIHYKSPVRNEAKVVWPEDELAEKQAEIMRRIYQEQRRTKYLNELHDMYSRRHTDNFIPSQKSPIPLNRYDDYPVDVQPPRPRDRTPEPKLVARALYNFVGQTSRELTFRRGDIIYVRRQIDKNWYEGEHNAMIGLFPFNYVEIIPYDGIRTLPKKASEGQARAKFNFQAQSHLELSLVKGELVLLTRRVDENWFEGRTGSRKGIFPVSYVEVLVEPGERAMSPQVPISTKPIVAPASHSVMLNGAKDMGQQHYQPPRPALYSSSSLPSQSKFSDISMVSQSLHIDTQSDPVPYRVLYNYRPQNEDELELKEGDVVYVMEKCDDGWYVGSLHRNGQFGTFPGNYVERIQ